jgi:hypothetical protein
MRILDRLKLQPRWKHSDPAVRLQAIPELVDPIELGVLAEGDPDAKVRRAAIAKVDDPVVLGRVLTSDADPGVQDVAADRLLGVALGASISEATTAAGLLSDVRRVSFIARSTAADAVREVALARLTDERALGGVARHAKVESTALAAAARLTSADELLSTVLNSEHRDVALAAFARVVSVRPAPGSDVALLKTIEARTRQKAVARRAKAMLRAIEDAENARRVAEDELRKQEALLCAAVESLAHITDPDRMATDLARMSAAWDALQGTDAATARRFAAGVDAARTRMTQRRSEIQAALEAACRRGEALASREALCRRIETLEGNDILEQLVPIEAEWAQLTPLVGYETEADQLVARFAQAVSACRKRHALQETRNALDALVIEAEALPGQGDEAAAARWRVLSREARALVAALNAASWPASDLVDRLAVVARAFEVAAAADRETAAKAKQDQRSKLVRLVARGKHKVESKTVTLREGERLLRDITAAFKEVGTGETTKEIGEAIAALRALQEQVARRVTELRDMDEWRRFANVQQQEELIAMAEAIVASLKAEEEAGAETQLAATAKALRQLQLRWRGVADAPHHTAQRLWDRFRAATDFIRSRCEIHFAQLRQERSTNLAAKAALIEQAEALVDSTDWNKTAAKFHELQKAWEDTGPVPRDAARDLARRFRAACNTFFTRRRDAVTSKKKEWDDNLARKEALCERAEQLTESKDWDAVASELKKLQADWKAIGPVRHDQSEVVWNRFRSAADEFFERYHNRHKIAAAEKIAAHPALVIALEGLIPLEEAPADLAAQVQTLRTTISNAPHVDGAEMKTLHERWQAALAALVARWPAAFAGTDLDPAAIRERMEKLVAKVERLIKEEEPVAPASRSTTQDLAERLRSALASNAMGVRADDSKWRAASTTVEQAQDAWQRITLVPDEDTRVLEVRFKVACKRVMDQVKLHVGPAVGGSDGGFRGGSPGGRPDGPGRAGGRGPRGRRSTRGSGAGATAGEVDSGKPTLAK